MRTSKLLISVTAICAFLMAILMLWNEESFSCELFWIKAFETMFIIVSLIASIEATKIKI